MNEKERLIEDFTGCKFNKIIEKKFSDRLSLFDDTKKQESISDSYEHHKDNRTEQEYLKELIYGWIIEDYAIYYLSNGIKLEKNGVDKDRKFLEGNKIKAGTDLKCDINKKTIYIEVISDFKGFWNGCGKIHLRDAKYLNLLKKSKCADTYILCMDIFNDKLGLIKISEDMNVKHIKSHKAFGGKEAHAIGSPTFVDKYPNFLKDNLLGNNIVN